MLRKYLISIPTEVIQLLQTQNYVMVGSVAVTRNYLKLHNRYILINDYYFAESIPNGSIFLTSYGTELPISFLLLDSNKENRFYGSLKALIENETNRT